MKHKHRETDTLSISRLHVRVEGREILKGITLAIQPGEVHAVMGPNGSGKSTLAYALMGHPAYEISGGSVTIGGRPVHTLPSHDRARFGLFLAFQSPTAIPGVSVVNLLRSAYQEIFGKKDPQQVSTQNPVLARRMNTGGNLAEFTAKLKKFASELRIDESFLRRGIHDGFSGGEKKKMEMLQALVLSPKYAIFDEIDTGLDVDALKLVAKGIDLLRTLGTGVIVITHYQRILSHIHPDVVHVLARGELVTTGGASLATQIEKEGYSSYLS